MGFKFGSFNSHLPDCRTRHLPSYRHRVTRFPLLRRMDLHSRVATGFVHIVAIIMTTIMIFHIRSKYPVGRKDIVMFYGCTPSQSSLFSHHSHWEPDIPSSFSLPDFALKTLRNCSGSRQYIPALWLPHIVVYLSINRFKFAEDGTPLSLWACNLVDFTD